MNFKGDFNSVMENLGLTPIGLTIGIIAFVISGAWVVFIPIGFIIVTYYAVKGYVENKICAAILSYYITSVIMSIMGNLIYYFPNTIGSGLFEAGYLLADFLTLNSIIDWIIKIQTDSWGIIYNWVLVLSAIIVLVVMILRRHKQ